ncbi:hypothetical protein [Pseudovibrio sp. Tun.PSC04-5.I4]|uniref:hypothetical protein n=1 Tax=Pseudovibrio sp. Tun.PSC04-5.I4 TaxID=1798213 RepID=UPI000B86257F|nr:hypothetical protein [Pseudovibrio sp. Tun.PSC04-5.I4]
MRPLTYWSPLSTYFSINGQLIQALLIALSFLGFTSLARAEPDIDNLKGSIALKGTGSTNIIVIDISAATILDLAYAKWAWTTLKSHEEVTAELAKYEGAYKVFEQAAQAEFTPRWKVKIKATPILQWEKTKRKFRAQVDREVFLQSTDQVAIARYRDLTLLEYKWYGNFGNTAPWHPEDWQAFESFYCDKHTRFLGFAMDGCAIPNWRRPDTDELYKSMYEERKREGRLEFLQDG